MREINRKLEKRRLAQFKPNEIEQSRQKLLSLMGLDDTQHTKGPSSKYSVSSKDSKQMKETFSGRSDSTADHDRKDLFSVRVVPNKESSSGKNTSRRRKQLETQKTDSPLSQRQRSSPRDDLKMLETKLLETQEIVDREYQTARELSQRVENMVKNEKKVESRTPSSRKTFGSLDLNSRSDDQSKRTESSDSVINLKKCAICHEPFEEKKGRKGEKRDKIRKMENVFGGRNNFLEIKRKESKMVKPFPKLKCQLLPSVVIKGGLQIQRVFDLEIPGEKENEGLVKANTEIKIFSHDDIEREKTKKIVEQLKKENCFYEEVKSHKNCVECFKCGNLISVKEFSVDPEEIDKLLLKCKFNVFDPRIDEFVEKWQRTGVDPVYAVNEIKTEMVQPFIQRHSQRETIEVKSPESSSPELKKNRKKETDAVTKRRFKLKEFSRELTRRYKEEADQLADDHLEFENILRSLFRKIEESREVFDDCHLFSSKKDDSSNSCINKKSNLTFTKPLVLSLSEDTDNVKVDSISLTKTREEVHPTAQPDEAILFRNNDTQRKLSKKGTKHKTRDKPFEDIFWNKDKILETYSTKKEVTSHTIPKESVTDNYEVKKVPPLVVKLFSKSDKEKKAKQVNEKDPSSSDNISSPKSESLNEGMRTENDYESDFECESLKSDLKSNEEKEGEDDGIYEEEEDKNDVNYYSEDDDDEDEDERGMFRINKKLSTITEVDSELEKKLSEEEKDPKSETRENTDNVIKVSVTGQLLQSKDNQLYTFFNNIPKMMSPESVKKSPKLESVKIRETSSSSSSTNGEPSKKSNGSTEGKRSSVKAQKKGNDEVGLIKNNSDLSVSQKSSATETGVTSLKEVLTALKTQFEKTQTLAEKLTENVKNTDVQKEALNVSRLIEDESVFFQSLRDQKFLATFNVNNLEKLKKDLEVKDTRSPKSTFFIPQLSSQVETNSNKSKNELLKQEPPQRKRLERTSSSSKSSELSDEAECSVQDDLLDFVYLKSDKKPIRQEKSDSSSNSEISFVRASSRRKSSQRINGNGSDSLVTRVSEIF